MFSTQLWSVLLLALPALAVPLRRVHQRELEAAQKSAPRGFTVPITRRKRIPLQRRDDVVGDEVGEAALGDVADFQYTIALQLGDTETSAHLGMHLHNAPSCRIPH